MTDTNARRTDGSWSLILWKRLDPCPCLLRGADLSLVVAVGTVGCRDAGPVGPVWRARLCRPGRGARAGAARCGRCARGVAVRRRGLNVRVGWGVVGVSAGGS